MSNYVDSHKASPSEIRFSPAHAWVRAEGDEATIGITAYAQEQMGDLLYLQLPRAGDVLAQGEPFGAVQSFKTTEDLVAPVDGEVIAVNSDARRNPKMVNGSPYDAGWLVCLRLFDPSQVDDLLDGAAYDAQIAAAG